MNNVKIIIIIIIFFHAVFSIILTIIIIKKSEWPIHFTIICDEWWKKSREILLLFFLHFLMIMIINIFMFFCHHQHYHWNEVIESKLSLSICETFDFLLVHMCVCVDRVDIVAKSNLFISNKKKFVFNYLVWCLIKTIHPMALIEIDRLKKCPFFWFIVAVFH